MEHVLYVLLALLMFFTINYIGAKSTVLGYVQLKVVERSDNAPAFNLFFRLFAPVTFITITAIIIQKIGIQGLNDRLWLAVVYQVIIRWGYNIIMGRSGLIDYPAFLTQNITAIIVAFFINYIYIRNNEFLLPAANDIGKAIWFGILVFLYQIINKMSILSKAQKKRKKKYIEKMMADVEKTYSDEIKIYKNTRNLYNLIIVVIIYEQFNRPKFARIIERMLFWTRRVKTSGIMQAKSEKYLSDTESIRIGTKILENSYKKYSEEQEESNKRYGYNTPERKTIADYNRDDQYVSEVYEVFNTIGEISKNQK